MKKLIALLLALITVCPMLVACGGNSTTPSGNNTTVTDKSSAPASNPGETSNGTESPSSGTELPESPFDNMALYEIKANDGTQLTWWYNYVQEAKDWEGTVWNIDAAEIGGKQAFVLYAGDDFKSGLETDKLLPGGGVKLGNIVAGVPNNKQAWILEEKTEGQYTLIPCGNTKFSLSCKDGAFSLAIKEENTTTFSITKTENKSTKYAQWISTQQNIIVRLPIDVVDQVYDRVKKNYTAEEQENLKERIEQRMQLFAEDVQKSYDAYIDLTGFVPYERIIVRAFEHQDVMAGVVGGDCNIYINVDWYVDDIEKMWLRWEEGKEDYNFCILHEMGHMFDWNRGWTFESEMQADLKATYVLYSHKDDEYGAYAAPAEYQAKQVFGYDTIEKAYQGLSSDMPYRESNGTVTYTYSIYRAAQRYTEYLKACEESEEYVGYEALKKTFHWFQDNGYTISNFTSLERFNKFNELLIEYSGGAKPEDYFQQRGSNKEWSAMCARGADIKSENGK